MSGETGEAQRGQPAAPKASGEVFISYASQDKIVADAVCQALERSGIGCWIAPRDVVPGESFAGAIVHAIDATRVIVLVLSEHSAASQHVLREVERASSKRHPVIAFRIDLAPMPADFEYFLNTSQWLDASAEGVQLALPKLFDAVQRAIASAASADYTGGTQRPAARPYQLAAVAKPTARRSKIAIVAVGISVTVGFGYFALNRLWLVRHSATERPTTASAKVVSEKSIAVLPFTDMSEKHDQEYFADGLAEELLNTLVTVPGLRVIGRTSSFQFKGKSEDLRTIGTTLGAAHIVEGSVRRSGNQVRVTAQLIRSSDGAREWSGTYDRAFTDMLQLQTEIGISLGRALEISVSDAMAGAPGKVNNADAYDLYLRGLHAANEFSRKGHQEAADDFQRSIELDPRFVRAYEMLGMVHMFQAVSGFVPADKGFAQIQEDASRTLKLDPHSVAAHVLMSRTYSLHKWDWVEAERESRAALALEPHNWGALGGAAELAITLGRFSEAEHLESESIVTDPLNPDSHGEMSVILLRLGRLKEAEDEARRCLAIAPTYVYGHSNLGAVLMAEGRFADALREFEQEDPEADQLTAMAMAYHALGREKESKASLERVMREQGDDQPFNIASAYAYLHQSDHAFEWLERAYRQRDPLLEYVQADWGLQNIAADRRFKAFLRKMKLPE